MQPYYDYDQHEAERIARERQAVADYTDSLLARLNRATAPMPTTPQQPGAMDSIWDFLSNLVSFPSPDFSSRGQAREVDKLMPLFMGGTGVGKVAKSAGAAAGQGLDDLLSSWERLPNAEAFAARNARPPAIDKDAFMELFRDLLGKPRETIVDTLKNRFPTKEELYNFSRTIPLRDRNRKPHRRLDALVDDLFNAGALVRMKLD